jgi:hypothetical protein
VLVAAGDCLKDEGGVADGEAEDAHLVERGAEGDEAVAGDAAVGRLDADDAAERGGLAD